MTADQLTVYSEIAVDLKGEVTMQRLIQGDVGVGKTIVVFIALLVAVQSGFQGAFLAPTELLARQHFINGKKLDPDEKACTDLLKNHLNEKTDRLKIK